MKNGKSGITIVKLFVILVIISVVVSLVCGVAGFKGLTVSDGVRIGTVQKATQKGIIWATNEVEIATEGLKSTVDGGMTSVWHASVHDDTVYEQIKELAGTDQPHQFFYKQERHVWWWQGETAYNIYKVEPVHRDAESQ